MAANQNQLSFAEWQNQQEEKLVQTPAKFRQTDQVAGTKAPLVIAGGFALLFGGLLYRAKASGTNMSRAFGEARVMAQGTALCGLVGFGMYMGVTEDRAAKFENKY